MKCKKILCISAAAAVIFSNASVPLVSAQEDYLSQLTNLVEDYSKDDYIDEIILKIGEPEITVNGKTEALDVEPEIIDDSTMLPIRAVVEAMGGTAGYDESTAEVTVSKGNTTLTMKSGTEKIGVNVGGGATSKTVSAPTKIISKNGRTFIPVRVVTEQLGSTVSWDGNTRSVTITNDYQTKRLIVKSSVALSFDDYKPKKVLHNTNDDLYIVQFDLDTDDSVVREYCKEIKNMSGVQYVEPDLVIFSSECGNIDSGSSTANAYKNAGIDDYIKKKNEKGQQWNDINIGIIEFSKFEEHKDFGGHLSIIQKLGLNDGHALHVAGIIDQCLKSLEKYELYGYGLGCEAGITKNESDKTRKSNEGTLTTTSTIHGCIKDAIEKNCKVINLSIQYGCESKLVERAIAEGKENGVTFVVAAGNREKGGGDADTCYPAKYGLNYDNVITVAAYDYVDSNHGNCVSISACGNGIRSYGKVVELGKDEIPYRTDKDTYVDMSGTSMATPHVAAAAAVLKSENTSLTPAQIKAKLTNDMSDSFKETKEGFGSGMLNMCKSNESKTTKDFIWSPESVEIGKGKTTKIKILKKYSDDTESDATDKFTFESSDESVAKVSPSGAIEGIAKGTAYITAKATEEGYWMTHELMVTVTEPIKKELSGYKWSVNSVTLKQGETKSIELYKTYTDRSEENITNEANLYSMDENVAKVSKNGTITAVAEGETEIGFDFAAAASISFPANIKVRVTAKPTADEITGYEWSDSSFELEVGGTADIRLYELHSIDGKKDITSSTRIYSIDEDIATVKNGKITAKASGETELSFDFAAPAGISIPRNPKIKVKAKPVVDEIIGYEWSEDSISLMEGETASIKLYALHSVKTKEDITSKSSIYSFDADVADVSSTGKITAISAGKTELSFSYAAPAGVKIPRNPVIMVTAKPKTIAYGDLNFDGKISSKDVSIMQDFVNRVKTPTDQQKKLADLDGNGVINAEDIKLIKKRVLGVNTPFPVEK